MSWFLNTMVIFLILGGLAHKCHNANPSYDDRTFAPYRS